MITASGVGSGIDVEGIITQLMEFERQPVTALTAKKENLDVELSAFGKVKSSMNELSSAAQTLGKRTSLAPYVATSSDEDVVTVTASEGALAENHDIEVLAIAQQHRMKSEPFESADAAVPQRTRTITSGENTFEITTDGSNSTLTGLRDAINDSADNTSVDASILNVDGGSRLVLTARVAGTANTIQVRGGGLLAQAEFSDLSTASDAELIIDGFAVTRSSNEISDVISGVTINLAGLGEASIQTERDQEGLRENLNKFVEQYNALRTTLNTEAQNDLQGDRLPRNAESRLREIFTAPVTLSNGESVNALEMGLTFDRNGVLSVETAELNRVTSDNMESFIQAFTQEETGISAQFKTLIDGYTRSDGLIAGRERGIDSSKGRIDDQIEQYEYRLEKIEARYRRQYGTMDELVGQLNNTSSLLTSRLTQT